MGRTMGVFITVSFPGSIRLGCVHNGVEIPVSQEYGLLPGVEHVPYIGEAW
jgi:hypothetical protein